MTKVFNIYVRVKDESADRGWTPICFAKEHTFERAMDVMRQPDLENLKSDHVLAMTINEYGGVYDLNEKTLAVGRLLGKGNAGIISDDQITLPKHKMPNAMHYIRESANWNDWWNRDLTPQEAIDTLDRTRSDDGRLIAGISAEVLSHVIAECGYTKVDYSRVINSTKAYSRYEISEDKFVADTTMPRRALDASPIDVDFLIYSAVYWLSGVNSKSVALSMRAMKMHLGANGDSASGSILRVIRNNLTLAMVMEDIMFE